MMKKLINKLLGKGEPICFQQAFDLTGMPIVTFNQGNRKFNFILDTGANLSIINSHVIDHLEHVNITKKSSISGLEGQVKQCEQCTIKLSYKGTEYESSFLVVDMMQAFLNIQQETGVVVHGLLGGDFFHKFQYVLDFKELIAYSRK